MKNFVGIKIALLAKERGFKEKCFNYKAKKEKLTSLEQGRVCTATNWNCFEDKTSIPLYQQMVDWFRETHKIFLTPHVNENGDWFISVKFLSRKGKYKTKSNSDFYKAFDKAFEYSIKFVKRIK